MQELWRYGKEKEGILKKLQGSVLSSNRYENNRIIDYCNYQLTPKEELRCVSEGILIVILFSYFFYRSFIAVIFLLPLIYYHRKDKKETIGRKKSEIIESQFKEVILSVWNYLQAGYSIENAFIGSLSDMKDLYGEKGEIVIEIKRIKAGIRNGLTLEELLNSLGKRCGGEVEKFTNVYGIAYKAGGKWQEVFEKTVGIITRKIELKQEIEVLIHEKEMESRIMCIIPFFILIYMELTSKNYFQVLYHNLVGIIIMTICMSIYLYAFYLIKKTIRIVG